MSQTVTTRAEKKDCFRFQILGTEPTDDDKFISAVRLPTVRQTILCFLAHHKSLLKHDAAKMTVDIITNIYERARVPMLQYHKMVEEVEKLHNCFTEILKIPKDRRDSGKSKVKIDGFIENLSCTFKLWPRNAMKLISLEEDRLFLKSMMSDRNASIAGIDSRLSKTEENIRKRKAEEMIRQQKSCERKETRDTVLLDLSEESECEADPDLAVNDEKRSHKRQKKTGVEVFLPPDILKSPKVVSSLVRNNISSTAITSVIHDIVEAAGSDPTKLHLSHQYAWRGQNETIGIIQEQIKDNWKPPQRSCLHWDGKLMDTLDGRNKEERLPILLSGVGGIKLLGVPAIGHKSSDKMGKLISESCVSLLKDWKCEETVCGMVFDTTASNTGAQTAGCVSIQNVLNRRLLWFACRHHVGEVILTHVWDALNIEISKSPDVSVFQRFKDNYCNLTYNDTHNLNLTDCPPTLQASKENTIEVCKQFSKQKLYRGDYNELVSLTLLYLGADEPQATTSKKKSLFKQPGALHKARWMAKLLYAIKIDLLSNKIETEFPKGTVFSGRNQKDNIHRFVMFVVYVYVPWWLTAPFSSSAPSNDLSLIKSLYHFKDIDSVAASAALKSLKNHMWYLTEELVPLSLFSPLVPNEEKTEIAEKLSAVCKETHERDNRHGTGFGKPLFPVIPPEADLELVNFVGKDSWIFFDCLKMNSSFLEKSVHMWEAEEDYQTAKLIVDNIRVCNDSAERGVKLASDFLQSSKEEQKLQNILQVVENSRSSRPDQRRKGQTSKSWYLHL